MKHVLIAVILPVFLAACASGPKPIPEDLSALNNGEKGAILASYGGYTSCHGISLNFQNIETKEEAKSTGLSAKRMESATKAQSKISVIPVSPGKYKFSGGSCEVPHGRGKTIVNFKGVTNWFESFEVKSGEVVYPGTLMSEVVAHKIESIIDIPDFISRAPTNKYQIFEQENRSDQVQLKLQEEAPTLSDKFVTRLAPKRLESDTVKLILNDIYKSEGKDDRPDGRVATQKANLALAKYLVTGKYKPSN